VPDEASLIPKIRLGDVEALAAYIESSRPRLLGLLRTIAGSHLLAVLDLDDLVQEIAVSAIAALPRIPREELDVDRWLDQLARRRVVDAHRHHFSAEKRSAAKQRSIHGNEDANSSVSDFEQMLISSITSPSAVVSRDFRLAKINRAVAELPELQQQVLRLRFSENLSTKEIAERCGKSDGAIRVLLSRTLQQLEKDAK
jgi:RNA polymerase sigma-70 factor, ECF subfamily